MNDLKCTRPQCRECYQRVDGAIPITFAKEIYTKKTNNLNRFRYGFRFIFILLWSYFGYRNLLQTIIMEVIVNFGFWCLKSELFLYLFLTFDIFWKEKVSQKIKWYCSPTIRSKSLFSIESKPLSSIDWSIKKSNFLQISFIIQFCEMRRHTQ